MSVETLSELKFVASQTGTSIEALETGFRRMQRSIYDAGRGLSAPTDALAETITGVAVKIGAWIRANREITVTVMKVVADVVTGGVAMISQPIQRFSVRRPSRGRTR